MELHKLENIFENY